MTAPTGASWPVVDGYQIVAEVGRGGFASVYEAVQESVGRRVALKVLSTAASDTDMERRFRSECRTIGELSWHPHVVALHDAGLSVDGRPYMAMEFLPGGSLADQVRSRGPLNTDDVIQVGIEIADALSAAHDAGVVHRDVKPANILIGRRGEYLLGDFGIATITDSTQSSTGSFSGTFAYCAPEVHQGRRADPQSDVFSLGASLYTLLAGQPAFMTRTDDAPSAVILRVVSEPAPPLPPSVPLGLVAAINAAMAKDPSDRPATAAEFRQALQLATTATESNEPSKDPIVQDPLKATDEHTHVRTPQNMTPTTSQASAANQEAHHSAAGADPLDHDTVLRATAPQSSEPKQAGGGTPRRSNKRSVLARRAPLVGALLLSVGLVAYLLTANDRGATSDESATPTTAETLACARNIDGQTSVWVSCETDNDGRVVTFVDRPEDCPQRTSYVVLNGQFACATKDPSFLSDVPPTTQE